MIEVALSRGLIALIDDEDADLTVNKWSAANNGCGHIYAARFSKRREGPQRRTLYLHRVIAGRTGELHPGLVVDHINGNTLDNRRSNLRVVTQSVNVLNSPLPHSHGSSGYRGVTFCRRAGKWRAQISIAGKQYQFGMHATAEEANRARLAGEARLVGLQPRRVAA